MTFRDDYREYSVRDRMYRDVQRESGRRGRIALASAIVAIGVALLIFAYSAYQVTEPDRAQNIIQRGLASVTDLDTYLEETLPALRELAETGDEAAYPLPGYPLDVQFTATELQMRSDAELRELLLSRASNHVYLEGVDAFQQEGGQSLGTFTLENFASNVLAILQGPTHDRAGIAAVVLLVVVVLAAATIALSDLRPGVLRTVGGALLAGSLAGLVLSIAIMFVLGQFGGDDPFSRDIAAIAQSVVEVPRRNFIIASIFSFILYAGGWGLTILERRAAATETAVHEDAWAEAYGVPENHPAWDAQPDDDFDDDDDDDYFEYEDDEELIDAGESGDQQSRVP